MVGDRLLTAAYIFIAVGLILFLLLLIRAVGRIMGKSEGSTRLKSRFGGLLDFILIILGVVLLLCAQGSFWLISNLKYHIPLEEKTELGKIETYSRPDWDYKQGFRFEPSRLTGRNQSYSFDLDGESWWIRAEETTWPHWLKFIGLVDSYKIDGIYAKGNEELIEDIFGKNFYEIDSGESGLVSFYNRFGGLILGMKAHTVDSKERYFMPGRSYIIYADSTGLLLQEMW